MSYSPIEHRMTVDGFEETYSTVEHDGRVAIRVDRVKGELRGFSIHLAWQEGDPEPGGGYVQEHCEYVEGKCWLAVVNWRGTYI